MRQRPPSLPPKPGGSKSLHSVMSPFQAREKPMRLLGGTGSPQEPQLPPGYCLDRSDPDVFVLRCPQGEAVARFSTRGATAEAIKREARAHHRERNRSA